MKSDITDIKDQQGNIAKDIKAIKMHLKHNEENYVIEKSPCVVRDQMNISNGFYSPISQASASVTPG